MYLRFTPVGNGLLVNTILPRERMWSSDYTEQKYLPLETPIEYPPPVILMAPMVPA